MDGVRKYGMRFYLSWWGRLDGVASCRKNVALFERLYPFFVTFVSATLPQPFNEMNV